MSELRENIRPLTTTCEYVSAKECPFRELKVCKECNERLDQILSAFKAHIAECERPDDPHTTAWHIPFIEGCEEFRKALMESLK